MLRSYQVVLKPVGDTEPGGLLFMNAAPEAVASFDYFDQDGNEVYSIEIADAKANWLELQLDQTDNVVSYKNL